jgi:hypothetical protein
MIGRITPWWASLVAPVAIAVAACNEDAPDGAGLVVEVLAEQPRSPDLGVSLAVHARGGHSVSLAIEQGALVADLPATSGSTTPQAHACVPAIHERFSFELSVRPADAEALLFASLFVSSDCSGEALQGRVLAIRPPAANPVLDDAGIPVERAP